MHTAKISKEYEFSAAHQLPNHKGKCRRLHGHNYKVKVWLKGDVKGNDGTTDEGMLVDYNDVDAIVKPMLEALDHRFLFAGDEPDAPAATEYYQLGLRSTAENLAYSMAMFIAGAFQMNNRVHLVGVEISETPKTTAEVIIDVDTLRKALP